MRIGLRWRLLDAARKSLGTVSASEMSLADIQAARRPYVETFPSWARRVATLIDEQLFGRPHPGVVTTADHVQGAGVELPARVHQPRHLPVGRPLLVHYHGGGWTIGAPEQYDWWCSQLAHEVGLTVVSVDYRKAPEHPAPIAADDAIAAFRWISEHRDRWDAGEAIAVGGDSAGGNLAALVAIAARDEDLRLDAQVLVYPGTDLTMSSPSAHALTDEPILPRESIDAFLGHYLRSSGIDPKDPRVSPFWADTHAGLAPALIQTAQFDPLVDEGDAYAGKLREAGVEVRHTRYLGVPHGFMSLPGVTAAARQGLAETADFLRRHLDA